MKNNKVKKINFINDLGNIKTTDGKMIKKGLLFRSSSLHKIKEKAIRFLKNDIGLKRVFDLRAPDELLDKPDKKIDGVEYIYLAPLSNFENPVVNRKTRKSVLKKLRSEEGGTKGHLENIYRKLISSPQAIASYKEMMKNIVNNPEEITIWHCSQGKDRTGIGSVILLLALGVNKEDIINDYLSFNKSVRKKNFLIYLAVSVLKLNIKMANSLHYLLTAQRSYIEAAFNEISEKFGTVDDYLHKALSLSNDDIAKLRKVYLV